MSLSDGFRWKRLVQVGPFCWGATAPWRAARVALGTIVPLAIGWASGRIDYGAYAALGALPAGFASFQGETRSRLAVVAVASLGMAASTFVGATTAAIAPWVLVPVVMVWGYVSGLAVALGRWSSVAILQWSVALLIAVGLPAGPGEAAVRAGLVLAGGLFQALLVAATWTVRRGARERTAVAASYRMLAGYASGLALGRSGPPPPIAFPAGTTLDDANPLLPTAARLMFLDLLEEAERIRASLAALAAHTTDVGQIRGLIADAANALDRIADVLSAPRRERVARVRDLSAQVAELAVAAGASWRWAGEAFLGQLRAVVRILARLEAVPVRPSADIRVTGPSSWLTELGGAAALNTLRAHVTTSTEPGRHALRLAVAAGLAEAMAQAIGLSQGHWIALTVFFVLKPDYSSTLYHSAQRAVGTLLGAGLGAAAAHLGHLTQGGLVAMAGIGVAAAYALFEVNYLLFSVFLTVFVVVLLDVLGIPAIPTAEARLVNTAIGGVLALLAYLAWPTWEHATAQEKFARLFEAHTEYTLALLKQVVHPGSIDAARLRALQAAARRARSDAEASTARLSDEPSRAPLTPEVAHAVTAALARFALASLSLHAFVLSQPTRADPPDESNDGAPRVDALAAALGTTMSRLAVALRTMQAPLPVPALRPIQAALGTEAPSLDSVLIEVTDRLVDAADTVDAILRDRLPRAR